VKITHVVGARPNFMKLAPCERALAMHAGVTQRIVHTGQHYDDAMSDAFFRDLGIPEPDVNLEVGSASHAAQAGRIMERLEPVVLDERPDWVLVYGDVNSTAAAALVCAKLGVRLAHVEAGLRSFDRTMPEEINRLVTDRLADLLLTPSRDADENLRREGIEPERIVFVGNVMVDSLLHALESARAGGHRQRLGLASGAYAVVTLHRPSNVDVPERLTSVCRALGAIAAEMPVVFPVHPRTRAALTTADRPVSRDAGVDRGRARRHHRFGGRAGGDHRAGRPLSHAARQHRATDHHHRGNESPGARSRRSARAGARQPAQWDGETARRLGRSGRRACGQGAAGARLTSVGHGRAGTRTPDLWYVRPAL
jgi:hypothetical protein